MDWKKRKGRERMGKRISSIDAVVDMVSRKMAYHERLSDCEGVVMRV
jgi:hypothetical protein